MPDISFVALMADLAADAQAIDGASGRAKELTEEYEGAEGVKLKYEAALDSALIRTEETLNWKPRSMKTIEAKARAKVQHEQPDLCAAVANAEAELKGLKLWLSGKERSSSVRQTILTAQRYAG